MGWGDTCLLVVGVTDSGQLLNAGLETQGPLTQPMSGSATPTDSHSMTLTGPEPMYTLEGTIGHALPGVTVTYWGSLFASVLRGYPETYLASGGFHRLP